MYACQASTFGNVEAAGTVAPRTALALPRCILSCVGSCLELAYMSRSLSFMILPPGFMGSGISEIATKSGNL